MKAVSNSSVLIALGYLGKVDILQQKFSEVYVPTSVWREVVESGTGKTGLERTRFGLMD